MPAPWRAPPGTGAGNAPFRVAVLELADRHEKETAELRAEVERLSALLVVSAAPCSGPQKLPPLPAAELRDVASPPTDAHPFSASGEPVLQAQSAKEESVLHVQSAREPEEVPIKEFLKVPQEVPSDLDKDPDKKELDQVETYVQRKAREQQEENGHNSIGALMLSPAMTKSGLTEPETTYGKIQLKARRVVSTAAFDLAIGVIIFAHSICIGYETSEKITYGREPLAIPVLEGIFLMLYTLELFARFFAFTPQIALKSNWVRFDALMVVAGLVDQTVAAAGGSVSGLDDIMLIRILRISRLARTARLMIQFRTLWMLVQGLMHSLLTLLWFLLIILVLAYIWAILGMELFKDTKDADPLNSPYDEVYIGIAQSNFGNLMDAMISMFQLLTLDSVATMYRPLIQRKPVLAVYFLSYLLLVPIALINIVTAIMVENSLKQASADQEAQRAWDARRRKQLMPDLVRLFKEIDVDNSGDISIDELKGAPALVKEQLTTICNWTEVEDIFNQLDYDRSGAVDIEEFCEGLLKASSDKPVELYCIMRQCCDILDHSRSALAILEGGNQVKSPSQKAKFTPSLQAAKNFAEAEENDMNTPVHPGARQPAMMKSSWEVFAAKSTAAGEGRSG